MKHIHVIKAFSKKLQEVRMKEGYSVLELARRSGVSRQHIRDLELADKAVTIRTLCKLANALETPMWKLMNFGEARCKW